LSLRAICKGSTASSDTHELLMRHFCHFRPLPMTSVKANSWLAVLPGHLPALLLGSEDRGGPPPPLPSDKALATTASTTCATTANTTIAPAAASDAASDAASAASSSSASSSIIDPARYVKAEYGSSAVSPSEVRATVRGCSVVVGMHPDEATGAAVDLAAALGKPFAVVPCCVFPNRYTSRRTCGHWEPYHSSASSASSAVSSKSPSAKGEGDSVAAEPVEAAGIGIGRRVKDHGDLVEHLLNRTPNTERRELDFGGRNVVVYTRRVGD
jgi:hypothetical protein